MDGIKFSRVARRYTVIVIRGVMYSHLLCCIVLSCLAVVVAVVVVVSLLAMIVVVVFVIFGVFCFRL